MATAAAVQLPTLQGRRVDRDELAIEHHDHQVILEEIYDEDLLTECCHCLLNHRHREGMQRLMERLHQRRSESSDNEWRDYVRMCRLHPIRKLIHEDPFTLRAYVKPRGYAGDAELLDFIYGVDEGRGPPPGTSELGEAIFHFNTRTTPACKGVRNRVRFVARLIDQLALEKDRPDILSIAAGHLREANLTEMFKQERLGRWVAFDADVDSVDEVKRSYGCHGVEAIPGTVRQLLRGPLNLGQFDFIYSTGLFDYLQQSLGKRLTSRCFQMLKPGGHLLIANFRTGIEGRGYMECFMDWNLTYRGCWEMQDLATGIDEASVAGVHLTPDEDNNILYLHVIRK
jgi:hypothetical protein